MRDADTNTVYLTAALKRHSAVFDTMVNELSAAGVEVKLVSGTDNVWIRDWAPLQVDDHFVKFRYQHDEKAWPQLHVPEKCWNGLGDVLESHIRLDGGNVVRYGDRVLMTEMIYHQNPEISRVGLVDELSKLLEAEIILLPVEPDDDLGHSDGIVKWIDAKRVFANDYALTWVPELQDYGMRLREVLLAHDIVPEPFPWAYQSNLMSEVEFRAKHPQADSFLPAIGYSINYLQVDGLILFPKFDIWRDNTAKHLLETTFPDIKVIGVPCRKLAMEGGCCNCVTMNYALNRPVLTDNS